MKLENDLIETAVIRPMDIRPIIDLRWFKLDDTAVIPTYANDGDSGLDVCLPDSTEEFILSPGERKLCKTGLKVSFPSMFEMQVRSKSGRALKQGLIVLNSPGTIEHTYRGEVGIILYNSSKEDIVIKGGKDFPIAQLVLCPVVNTKTYNVKSTLYDSEDTIFKGLESTREGGFGSTYNINSHDEKYRVIVFKFKDKMVQELSVFDRYKLLSISEALKVYDSSSELLCKAYDKDSIIEKFTNRNFTRIEDLDFTSVSEMLATKHVSSDKNVIYLDEGFHCLILTVDEFKAIQNCKRELTDEEKMIKEIEGNCSIVLFKVQTQDTTEITSVFVSKDSKNECSFEGGLINLCNKVNKTIEDSTHPEAVAGRIDLSKMISEEFIKIDISSIKDFGKFKEKALEVKKNSITKRPIGYHTMLVTNDELIKLGII